MYNTPSQEDLVSSFQERIEAKDNQEKYHWEYISELYIRYMQSATTRISDILGKDRTDISPTWVVKKLDKEFKKQYWVKQYSVSYQDYIKVLMNIWEIWEDYNTEDGQIRWLKDNNYDIHLWSFYSIIPQEIKKNMTEWKNMDLPLKTAIEIREKLERLEKREKPEKNEKPEKLENAKILENR